MRRTGRILLLAGSGWLIPMLALGCGGTGEVSDAVVVPEPGVKAPAAPASPPSAPAPATSPAPPSSAPSAAPVKAEGWGTLKGMIRFGGDAPAIKVLQEKGKAEKDPDMCAVDAPILSERLIVDQASRGVKNVLVYLSHPTAVHPDAQQAASASTVLFDQKKCTFQPHVLAVMAGVPIDLRSSDPKPHNVNVKLRNSTFNQSITGGQTIRFKPAAPERMPGPVVCDIHPWMSSWWMVLDHPYFAVTNQKGEFEIKNVPAGVQKVVVWQEAVGFVSAPSGDEVTIKAGEPTIRDVTIDPAKVRPGS